jgi:hypothetical protein
MGNNRAETVQDRLLVVDAINETNAYFAGGSLRERCWISDGQATTCNGAAPSYCTISLE